MISDLEIRFWIGILLIIAFSGLGIKIRQLIVEGKLW